MGAEVILFTSLKGGCGKSTVCANLAYTLSLRGKRTLALSLDQYNGSLDILFGCGDFLFDISDFPEKTPSQICLPVENCKDLSLAQCMPFPSKDVDAESFISYVKACGEYDLILADKGFDTFASILSLSAMADRVCIISTQTNDSLRCAELLGCMLYEKGIADDKMSLILNSFYTDTNSLGYYPSIGDIITETKLSLLGIVPFSDELCVKQCLAKDIKDSLPQSAFRNISERILGENVKILDFLPAKNRRLILNNGCSGGNKI